MDDRVDLVRRAYGSWNEDGVPAAVPLFHERIELSDPPQMPDARTFRGLDDVLARINEVGEALGREGVDLLGVEPVGDEVLVSLAWQSGERTGSGLMGLVYHLVRVEDGRITRIRVFLDDGEARGAL